jgi:hypothetical protein
MAIKTTSTGRIRTIIKTFFDTVLSDLETAYATYETDKAIEDTKTWSVRVIAAGWDGTNYFIIAEASYPETNANPAGQVPQLGGE